MSRLDPEVDGGHVPHQRFTLQRLEIFWLGSLTFAEDEKSLLGLASCHLSLERLRRFDASASHQVALVVNPRARCKTNWSSSGTAPNLP